MYYYDPVSKYLPAILLFNWLFTIVLSCHFQNLAHILPLEGHYMYMYSINWSSGLVDLG